MAYHVHKIEFERQNIEVTVEIGDNLKELLTESLQWNADGRHCREKTLHMVRDAIAKASPATGVNVKIDGHED